MQILNPEVLSPVGSYEALEAAVRSGADAVYLGAKQFSARRNADNFDNMELKSAVAYCKVRNVKVYLAVNIMIGNGELEDALKTVRQGVECGIDAVIIADLGLARLIHSAFPNLQLHASTQMTIHSPSPLKYLKTLGFSRVVAAREMSKSALENFCKEASALGIEVEVFVHGALCMCVSGQCLLSSVIGGRSGNRGLCAGPCRLPFKVKGGTGYDLSLKDLSLISYVDELKKMGVASLKIEGRMKRPEYIAAATKAFRLAVDKELIPIELSDALNSVFTRSGFTDGYYKNKLGKDMFGIRTEGDAELSKSTFSYLHGLYRNERSSVPVKITAEIKKSTPISVTFDDGKEKITVLGEIPQIAQNKQATSEDVFKALNKLGGTPYFADNIHITLDEGLFVPASELNNLRRQAVELLSEQRAKIESIEEYAIKTAESQADTCREAKIYARFRKVSDIPEKLGKITTVILPLDAEIPQKLVEGIRYAVELPRWIDNEEYVLNRLSEFKNSGFSAALCGTLGAVSLALTQGLEVIGGMGLNVYNSQNADVLKDFGVNETVLSAEISIKEAKKLNLKLKKGIFAYGRIPLMMFKNCPLKNGDGCKNCNKEGKITDRMGVEFPIMCSGTYSELYNFLPTYMADKSDDISGFDFILLYFTNEGNEQIEKLIEEYTFGALPEGNFTRGLYYRNIL